ncbi:MAG: hypothetical protein CL484_09680 [Acidobacteria bacterium]|nr:hypothetical protein [Acidobacteriota bacterium]|tara:strand:+ start:1436 stop:2941 length:1506 start_codon:yes stop_codon:yes gene_type:complete
MKIPARCLLLVCGGALALQAIIGAQSIPVTVRGETQIQLGNILLEDQRYWEAIRVFEETRQFVTGQQLVRASAGVLEALLSVAQFTRAQVEAERLRVLAPEQPDILALVGDALWAGGLFDEAEGVYRDVLALEPSSGQGRHGLAKSLATRQEYDEALNWLGAAFEGSPSEPIFHHTLGHIYERTHRFSEAADAYQRYLDLLPPLTRNEKVDWARAQVQFLRSFGERPAVQLASPNQLHTIPFRLVRDKVVVRGRINGMDAVDFVVDTGAEQTVLSQPVARQFGVQAIATTLTAGVGEIGLRRLQSGRLESLEFGSLGISNLPALIKSPPLGGLPTLEAEGFSPLALGLSMIVDYGRRELTIGKELPEEPYDIGMPLRQHRLTVIRGTVGDEIPRSFVVDTGGEVISISLGTALLLPPLTVRRVPVNVYGTSGWDEQAYLRPGTNLAFQQLLYPNYSVVVLNLHRPSALLGFHIGGIIGHEFLSDYRVTLDLNRSMMKLLRL